MRVPLKPMRVVGAIINNSNWVKIVPSTKYKNTLEMEVDTDEPRTLIRYIIDAVQRVNRAGTGVPVRVFAGRGGDLPDPGSKQPIAIRYLQITW